MKKVLVLGLLAVSAATILASCSSTTSENLNSRPGRTNSAAKGGVTITDGKATIIPGARPQVDAGVNRD